MPLGYLILTYIWNSRSVDLADTSAAKLVPCSRYFRRGKIEMIIDTGHFHRYLLWKPCRGRRTKCSIDSYFEILWSEGVLTHPLTQKENWKRDLVDVYLFFRWNLRFDIADSTTMCIEKFGFQSGWSFCGVGWTSQQMGRVKQTR